MPKCVEKIMHHFICDTEALCYAGGNRDLDCERFQPPSAQRCKNAEGQVEEVIFVA